MKILFLRPFLSTPVLTILLFFGSPSVSKADSNECFISRVAGQLLYCDERDRPVLDPSKFTLPTNITNPDIQNNSGYNIDESSPVLDLVTAYPGMFNVSPTYIGTYKNGRLYSVLLSLTNAKIRLIKDLTSIQNYSTYIAPRNCIVESIIQGAIIDFTVEFAGDCAVQQVMSDYYAGLSVKLTRNLKLHELRIHSEQYNGKQRILNDEFFNGNYQIELMGERFRFEGFYKESTGRDGMIFLTMIGKMTQVNIGSNKLSDLEGTLSWDFHRYEEVPTDDHIIRFTPSNKESVKLALPNGKEITAIPSEIIVSSITKTNSDLEFHSSSFSENFSKNTIFSDMPSINRDLVIRQYGKEITYGEISYNNDNEAAIFSVVAGSHVKKIKYIDGSNQKFRSSYSSTYWSFLADSEASDSFVFVCRWSSELSEILNMPELNVAKKFKNSDYFNKKAVAKFRYNTYTDQAVFDGVERDRKGLCDSYRKKRRK